MSAEKIVERINEQIAKVVPGLVDTGHGFRIYIDVDEELYTSFKVEGQRTEIYEPWEEDN